MSFLRKRESIYIARRDAKGLVVSRGEGVGRFRGGGNQYTIVNFQKFPLTFAKTICKLFYQIFWYGEPVIQTKIQLTDLHFSMTPNPFNSETKLSFQLLEAGQVRISVYDISGRLVTTVIDGFQQAGEYQLPLNGYSLATGIYLVHLVRAKSEQIQKLVVLR